MKDGTRIIKKASRSNRRGAEKELALMVSEIETKPGLRRLKKTTVGKMCEEYLEYAKVNHLSWKSDRSRLKTLVHFWGPHTQLDQISTKQIERFKASRLVRVKSATLNREVSLLKRLLNVAIEWGYLYENPARQIKPLASFDSSRPCERIFPQLFDLDDASPEYRSPLHPDRRLAIDSDADLGS